MQLTLTRTDYTGNSTIGELSIDGEFFCYTLEDVRRPDGYKVKGQTAIPAGTYDLLLTYSPKYGKIMPLIANVPMFEGIRIHSGNDKDDTEGCILVGRIKDNDFIGESKLAFSSLFLKLEEAIARDDCITITIENTQ